MVHKNAAKPRVRNSTTIPNTSGAPTGLATIGARPSVLTM
jgi:hypothetical protein